MSYYFDAYEQTWRFVSAMLESLDEAPPWPTPVSLWTAAPGVGLSSEPARDYAQLRESHDKLVCEVMGGGSVVPVEPSDIKGR